MGRFLSLMIILIILFGVGFVGLLIISNPAQQNPKPAETSNNNIDENNQENDETDQIGGNENNEQVKSITKNDLVNIIEQDVSLSAFSELVKAADLDEILGNYSNLVIIAPNNEALAKLPQGEIDRLLLPENSSSLIDILSNHIFEDKIDLENIYDLIGKSIKSISDQEYQVNIDRGQVLISGKRISDFEVTKTENLVLHISEEIL